MTANNLQRIESNADLVNRAEIDMQVATAHKFPRSLQGFNDEVMYMVTKNEATAGDCIYSLPRNGTVIEGASARFAEVIANAWGNCRRGARVIEIRNDVVVAQGVFHDLQKNVATSLEVQRKIIDKNGKRFSADMINMTANAACSVAVRNAVLQGIPKSFWGEMYEAARKVVMGDVKTLVKRRADFFAHFQRFGITQEQIFNVLGVKGAEDIGLDHIVILRGIATAIKEGELTPETAFAVKEEKPAINMPERKSKQEKNEQTASEAQTTPTAQKTETALDAIGGDDAEVNQTVNAEQLAEIKSILEKHGLDERAFDEEFGYLPEQLPARLYEVTINNLMIMLSNP